MPAVIFFDIGGVLVSDPLDPWYASMKRTSGLERLDAYDKIRDLWARFKHGDMEEAAFWESVALNVSAPPSKAHSWRLVPYAEMAVLDGAKDVIRLLHKHNLKVGIISNMSKEWGNHIFSRLLPRAWFDPVILSCDTGNSKPDPEIFEKARKSAGNPDPKDCLFFDNSRKNVDAALALGWDAALVSSPADVRKELANRGLS